MITKQELLDYGFRQFNPIAHSYAKEAFQLKLTDDLGIKYFLNVYYYEIEQNLYRWAVKIVYNDGASGLKNHALEIHAYCINWDLQDILKFGEIMWDRIIPTYYEIYDS